MTPSGVISRDGVTLVRNCTQKLKRHTTETLPLRMVGTKEERTPKKKVARRDNRKVKYPLIRSKLPGTIKRSLCPIVTVDNKTRQDKTRQ